MAVAVAVLSLLHRCDGIATEVHYHKCRMCTTVTTRLRQALHLAGHWVYGSCGKPASSRLPKSGHARAILHACRCSTAPRWLWLYCRSINHRIHLVAGSLQHSMMQLQWAYQRPQHSNHRRSHHPHWTQHKGCRMEHPSSLSNSHSSNSSQCQSTCNPGCSPSRRNRNNRHSNQLHGVMCSLLQQMFHKALTLMHSSCQ